MLEIKFYLGFKICKNLRGLINQCNDNDMKIAVSFACGEYNHKGNEN